jgi:hypothetical protein
VTDAGQEAYRWPRYLAYRGVLPGELTAALAVAALLAQVLLAQLTLALGICFLIVGRITRWRPCWLLAPAGLGLAWTLAVGRTAVTGYLTGGSQVIGYLAGAGSVVTRLAHLGGGFGGWRQWLPAQLPVALIAAAAQTAGIGALGHGRARYLAARDLAASPPESWPSGARYRPGLIVGIRRRYLAMLIANREMATGDGGCLGMVPQTGRPAAISWHEAGSGVLCTGQDASTIAATALELVSAAIARRKTVIVVDLAGAARPGAARHAAVESPDELDAVIARICAAAGAPLRGLADPGCRYEPLACRDPADAADLVLAMFDWRGMSQARCRFCAEYLAAALAVIAEAGPTAGPVAVLDELAGLLRPGALAAAAGQMPGRRLESWPLAGRVRELAGQLDDDPALIAPVAGQLAALTASWFGARLRPGQPSAGDRPAVRRESAISLRRALADRDVVLFSLDRRLHGRCASMVARLVVADLTAILAEQGALVASADCLVWVSGCEVLDPRQLTGLVGAGADAGAAVLLGTAAEAAATRLAGDVNVVMVRGPAAPGLAALLGPAGQARAAGLASGTGVTTADLLGQRPDEFSLVVRSPTPRVLVRCRAAR